MNEEKAIILVVDDEKMNVDVLVGLLSDDYRVVIAKNGNQALKRVKLEPPPDLILLDIIMPDVDGFEVCRRLKADESTKSIPVIFLTVKGQEDEAKGLELGAVDYINKPFSPAILSARIHTHLGMASKKRLLEDLVKAKTAELLKTNISYSRFVPHEFLRFLKKDSILEVNLGDHISGEMAVMFSDINSFTAISETMTSQENFNFVNSYFKRVSPVIRENNGFIVKFLGDGMMAVFPDDVEDAVRAGIEKLTQVSEYNEKRKRDGRIAIQIGIGVHTGHMMVGMVGEAARMQGDAFSDSVNLTARLESLTRHYGVGLIISGEAFGNLSNPDRYHIRFLDNVAVKGRQGAIKIYEVFDADPKDLISRKLLTQSHFEKGQRYYFAKEFADAAKCFKNVLDVIPADQSARLYLKRSAKFLVEGVPSDWQGVRTLNEK